MRRLWRRIILAIAIGAGVPAPLLAWPRDPAPPQLVVSLRLDKATFESGEAVPITVEILNRGESEYAVQTSTEDTGALDGCVFTVMDGNGEAVPTPRELPKSSNWIGSWLVLKRNEKYERKLFLNHWFLPLAPGRYSVSVGYTPRSLAAHESRTWPTVRSPNTEFIVTPPTETKLDVRLDRLAEQAKKGDPVAIDFLGFTGAWQAVEPLLAAMYNDDLMIRRRAANALNFLDDQPIVLQAVIAKARERGPNATVAEWLQFVSAPADKLLPLYFQYANSDDVNARIGAITGLRLGRELAKANKDWLRKMRAALLKAAADEDARVRSEAFAALAFDTDAQALQIITAAARGDESFALRRQAMLSLSGLRAEAVVPHVRELLLRDYRLRPNFAEQLREIGSPSARAALRDGLKSANPRVRDECAKQLWILKDAAAKDVLAASLRGGDAETQAQLTAFLQPFARSQTNSPAYSPDATPQMWADWLEKQ